MLNRHHQTSTLESRPLSVMRDNASSPVKEDGILATSAIALIRSTAWLIDARAKASTRDQRAVSVEGRGARRSRFAHVRMVRASSRMGTVDISAASLHRSILSGLSLFSAHNVLHSSA